MLEEISHLMQHVQEAMRPIKILSIGINKKGSKRLNVSAITTMVKSITYTYVFGGGRRTPEISKCITLQISIKNNQLITSMTIQQI